MTPAQLHSLTTSHSRVTGKGRGRGGRGAAQAVETQRGTLADLAMFAAMPRSG